MGTDKQQQGQVQGEGDRESAQEYNERTKDFVESGKVQDAAEKAGDQSQDEARRSEEEGKSRAKELDPEVNRNYEKPADK